jgi:lipopolysaccharide/colanic/teichoic acid biosynthesis glycosyltransferase
LVRERKTVVFGSGSSNGIQVEHFWPSPARLEDAERLRVRLGIPDSAPVIGYVGRFTRDKGIIELTTAFAELRPRFPGVRLLMVGCFEDGDPVPDYVRETIESSAHIIRPGFVADSAPYYQIMDVLAFPTHREGFGNAAVEAAAAGVPVVTTDATGAVDTVVDGVTGFVIPKGDHRALAAALHRLLADPELARRMGKAGQERALREFRPERIWEELHRLYLELLDDPPIRRTGLFIKHSLDLVISTLGLVVLAVPMLMIALTIRLDSPGPVLFKQLRVGYRGAEFWIYKFRSMVAGEHAPGSVASPRDPRVTRLGRLMRHVGLDELPQLLNVLRGEMSLVGPRPLLKTSMRPDKVRRLNMRPGVTGPAVIDAHKRPTREEQDNEDVRYVDRWSLLRDLRILLRTIPALVRPRDHYETE